MRLYSLITVSVSFTRSFTEGYMNIFKILSSGDGAIKEPNVTAFLSYLLDPNEGHGLNSKFLEEFLSPIILENPEIYNDIIYQNRVTDLSNKSRFSVFITIEKSVFISGETRRDIDIFIELSDEMGNVKYVFSIENKIQNGAIKSNQLLEQSEGIYNLYKENREFPHISIIYLTPNRSNNAVSTFEKFVSDIESKDYSSKFVSKKHYFWSKVTERESDDYSVFQQLQRILKYDNNGLIDPIHEYTKYTIKSFLSFILNNFRSYNEEKEITRERKKYLKPVREYYLDLYNKLNDQESISVKDAKKYVKDRIEGESGISVEPVTLRCQLYLVIVNERNRVHYGANEPLSNIKNLFFYSDSNRDMLLKFKRCNNIDDVEVFWRNGKEVECLPYHKLQ